MDDEIKLLRFGARRVEERSGAFKLDLGGRLFQSEMLLRYCGRLVILLDDFDRFYARFLEKVVHITRATCSTDQSQYFQSEMIPTATILLLRTESRRFPEPGSNYT